MVVNIYSVVYLVTSWC